MDISREEQATIHFYEWERFLRGYYHFESAVHLEPIYRPFEFIKPQITEYDDGKVPSLLKDISDYLFPKEELEQVVSKEEKLAYVYEPTTDLVGFSIRFPSNTEVQPLLFQEWLNGIASTDRPVSFEISAKSEEITFQIVSHSTELYRIQSQFQAYFPNAIIRPIENVLKMELDMFSKDISIVDFAPSEEVMRPLKASDSFQIDPLISLIATMSHLQVDEVIIFQILFQGVESPWAYDLQYSVSDGQGGSFFSNAPEMLKLVQDKTSDPLFSVITRIAIQSNTNERRKYLRAECCRNISNASASTYNSLVPLNNKEYEYDHHIRSIFLRCSNRLGFLINTRELINLLHYPNKTVVSPKIGIQEGKTKALPESLFNQTYHLGINEHNGKVHDVSLNDEMRLRHTHIIGATGVGKSTLIANMLLIDAEYGNGCAIFDPHGDICDDILARIPIHRINDVILVDPSDIEYPVGFNLLGAATEAEKIILSSDLVSSFKRYATAWGDNMTAVLSNAINTFLEHPNGGTIIELKRFILEDTFREQFLESIDDPSLHYYWKNEYPMMRKGITPLLTRIDTFLRPKTVRHMLAQKEGLDFRKCIEQKKILLIKLSQGLIGEENSYLLGSLFLAKLNQVAIGRQSLPKSQRHPFYVYCDEFQNFITPSINSILSGARKYGLGLILAHQELAQIDDSKTLNSVISNPYTRICFRLGDSDAKRLESGFSFFEQNDLQSLGIGQAIMRVGSSSSDFNIQTPPLSKLNESLADLIQTQVFEKTRERYGKPRAEIEQLLVELLPNTQKPKKVDQAINKQQITEVQFRSKKTELVKNSSIENSDYSHKAIPKKVQQNLIDKENEITEIRDHRYIQNLIKKLGQERGYKATIEKQVKNNRRIDIVLEKDEIKIAFEISVTNTPEYEVKNITKCISNEYPLIIVVSKDATHLNKIKKLAQKKLAQEALQTVAFIHPSDVSTYLNNIAVQPTPNEEIVKGFRVTTRIENNADNVSHDLKSRIAKLFTRKK